MNGSLNLAWAIGHMVNKQVHKGELKFGKVEFSYKSERCV